MTKRKHVITTWKKMSFKTMIKQIKWIQRPKIYWKWVPQTGWAAWWKLRTPIVFIRDTGTFGWLIQCIVGNTHNSSTWYNQANSLPSHCLQISPSVLKLCKLQQAYDRHSWCCIPNWRTFHSLILFFGFNNSEGRFFRKNICCKVLTHFSQW